jgi:uncharacterized lipoprotein YddW (UPF0748 family)
MTGRASDRMAGARLRILALGAATLLGAGCTVVTVEPPSAPAAEAHPVARPAPPDPDRRVDARDLEPPYRRHFSEVRGLWVVRYTMTSEESVRSMVERADAAGINTLIVQIRGRADAFYASALEPRAEPLRAADDFDPLAYAVEEAHGRGMAVHAWVNTHLVWGPAERPRSPEHVVNAHPGWLAVPRSLAPELAPLDPSSPEYVDALIRYARERPGSVEGLYSSPSHPAVQERVYSVWMDLAARYDLDGIHFDYIRYPSADFDYSIGALERFRTWALPRVPEARFQVLDKGAARGDLFAFVDGLPELWDDFRREQITGLVERIYRDVKVVRPGLVVSAAVVADARAAYEQRFQDWRRWLSDGILDVAVPMAYTTDHERFSSLIRDARGAAGASDRMWAGIGSYMNTPDGTVRMIDVARAEGAGGVVLFSYDWAVGEGQGDPGNPFLQRVGGARFGNR